MLNNRRDMTSADVKNNVNNSHLQIVQSIRYIPRFCFILFVSIKLSHGTFSIVKN